MPAKRFFAMLTAARKLKASDRLDQCQIAMIPAQSKEYYDQLTEAFSRQLVKEELPNVTVLADSEAKGAVLGMFGG